MTYNEWRDELKNNLLSVTENERKRVLDYYAEAYADRREAGFSEREIIEEFGAPYDAAQRILGEADEYGDVREDVYEKDNVSNYSVQEVKKSTQNKHVPQERAVSKSHDKKKEQRKPRKKHVWLAVVLSIVAVIVLFAVLGVVIIVGINGWQFVTKVNWESRTYECYDTITDIDLEFSAGQLKIERYDGDTIKAEYSYCDQFTTEFTVTGTRLSIYTTSLRWFNTILWFNKIPTTTLYIPSSLAPNLDVEVNAGHVTISEGAYGKVQVELNAGAIMVDEMQCSTCTIEVNAGALNIKGLSCSKLVADVSAGSLNVNGLNCDIILLEVSAGSANLTVLGNKEDYTIVREVSAGSCNVNSQVGKCDPYKHISVGVSAGSANILFEYPVSQQ